jgi:hypothetical protein
MPKKKKAPADFVKWLQSQLKAFRARRFEDLDVEVLGDELQGWVATYRYAVEEHAERLIAILMRREYVYGDWNDLMYESSMLDFAIRHRPSLAKTAPAQIKGAYRLARGRAKLHGEGIWPAKCPWPTLDAFRRAMRARDRNISPSSARATRTSVTCVALHGSRRVTVGIEDLRMRITTGGA